MYRDSKDKGAIAARRKRNFVAKQLRDRDLNYGPKVVPDKRETYKKISLRDIREKGYLIDDDEVY